MTNSSTLLNDAETRSHLEEKHEELAQIVKNLSRKNLSRLLLFAKGLLKNGD